MSRRLFVAGMLLSVATGASAGTIGYRINDGATQTISVSDTPPYTNIEIPLGVISGNTDLQIFTAGGGSAANVGTITIKGTDTANFLFVRVLIADGATVTAMANAFADPVDPVDPGLRSIGGLTFAPATGQTATLRELTVASINTLGGDITGTVESGVFSMSTAAVPRVRPRLVA